MRTLPGAIATALAIAALATEARPASAAPPVRRCAPITWSGVAALFDRWNASLAGHDASRVAANYAPDALLLPAYASTPRAGREAIRDYYAALLPLAPHARVVQRTIKVRCNVALDVGVMSMHLTDSGGVESTVATQYSFVYEFRDGRWVVAHDHASVIQREDPVPAAAAAAAPAQ